MVEYLVGKKAYVMVDLKEKNLIGMKVQYLAYLKVDRLELLMVY
jgi:hypothetical protein